MGERAYSRKYLRIKPESPLFADVAIVFIGERQVSTGTARVQVLDLSPGGLRFVSHLNFPVDNRVILELDFKVIDQRFKLQGYIVHKTAVKEGEYQYGICFKKADENLKACIRKLFSNMMVCMNKHIILLRLK